MIGPLVLLGVALGPGSVGAAGAGHHETAGTPAQGQQVVQGEDGWTLEVQANPVPVTVGHLVQFAIWLRQNGEVFPGMTEMSLEVYNEDDAEEVMATHLHAPQGHATPSLQLYDGAPHTATITVQPVLGGEAKVAPLKAALRLEVIALHPPLSIQLRMMAILLGVLLVGMAVGFFVPWTSREQASA
jgi:hypothetical protein